MSDLQGIDESSPFRRLPWPLRLVRLVLRRFRILKIELLNRGKTRIASNLVIGGGAEVLVPEFFTIEADVAIGGAFFSQTNVKIGRECLLSSKISFVGNDHDIFASESAYFSGRDKPSTVVLEGNNFIGFGATVVGDVTIGEGAVVGARAVVVKSVPKDAVVVGVPAKIIRTRHRPVR